MSEDNIIKIITHLQNNLKPLGEVDQINDIPGVYAIALNSNDFPFFNDPKIYDDVLIKKHCNDETINYLSELFIELKGLENWDQITIKQGIDNVISGFGIGFGKVGLPLRLALTATINSPSIDLVCEIIGKEVTLLRLDNFMKRIKS